MGEQKELASNRKAYHDYEILETFEAGIVLLGSEVKSLRLNGASLQEGYVVLKDSELWLLGVTITPYAQAPSKGGTFGHEERRERKLLMHKREILKLKAKVAEKGFTIIPLSLYFKAGKVKAKIALGKGKKAFDKRKKIKEEEVRREMKQAARHQ